MARRREFTVDDVPLVGGARALDFLNTTGNRSAAQPRERLRGYPELVRWSARVGLLDTPTAERLINEARRRPVDAKDAYERAIRLREDLYAVLASLAVGETPRPSAIERLDRWFSAACAFRSLAIVEGRANWMWNTEATALDAMLWPILGSADGVLMANADRLKKCGECDWLFIDESRNGSRRWCKKLCADRVRSRRYYARRRET